MKAYRIHFAEEAEGDLLDIALYVAAHDGVIPAEQLLAQLEELSLSLAQLPMRGHIPPELERIGVDSYREVHFKPYRIIYEVTDRIVYIHCVLDGRRDIQSLLERRLLR